MRTMRQILGRLMLGGWLLLAGVGAPTAFAQDAAPKSGVVTTTTSGSGQIVEYFMVIVMFGGALFAICRSSRRNA